MGLSCFALIHSQIRAVDVVCDDEDRVILAADFVDASNVRMVELGRRSCFAQEHFRLELVEKLLPGDFNGNSSLQLRITHLPHTAESAGTNFA